MATPDDGDKLEDLDVDADEAEAVKGGFVKKATGGTTGPIAVTGDPDEGGQ